MDGFSLIKYKRTQQPEGAAPYQYVNPAKIAPYRSMAAQWGLADEMFETQGSDSFTAHQDLIRGGTFLAAREPDRSADRSVRLGMRLVARREDDADHDEAQAESRCGAVPCSNKFPNYGSDGYKTLRDLLDAKSLSWKYYAPTFGQKTPDGMWNAFDVIAPVRYGPEWTTNISSPETNILHRHCQWRSAGDVVGGSRRQQLRPPRLRE